MNEADSKRRDEIKRFWAGSPILDEGEDMTWLLFKLDKQDQEIERLRKALGVAAEVERLRQERLKEQGK